MIEKLRNIAESSLRARYRVDATRFGDPVAAQVDWFPLVPGGRFFRTHHLVARPPSRWEFRPGFGIWLLSAVLVLFGVGLVTLVHVVEVDPAGPGEPNPVLVAYLLGALFVVTGLFTGYRGITPIVFDRVHNAYWRGWLRPGARPDASTVENFTRLNDIHALQIIGEWVSDESLSFRSYELNLVLRDGQRVHLVDHDDDENLRADAAELARMLSVPVWDVTVRPSQD